MAAPPLRSTRTDTVLHRPIALLLIGHFAVGWRLNDIPRNTPARGVWINLYKSAGLVIGLLILLRTSAGRARRCVPERVAIPVHSRTLPRRR